MFAPMTAEIVAPFAGDAALVKAAVEVPVMVTGSIGTLQQAAEILAAGSADIAGMVRAQIADPRSGS